MKAIVLERYGTPELYVDPDTVGTYVEDCAVCCRPWQVRVSRDERGEPTVSIDRAQ